MAFILWHIKYFDYKWLNKIVLHNIINKYDKYDGYNIYIAV